MRLRHIGRWLLLGVVGLSLTLVCHAALVGHRHSGPHLAAFAEARVAPPPPAAPGNPAPPAVTTPRGGTLTVGLAAYLLGWSALLLLSCWAAASPPSQPDSPLLEFDLLHWAPLPRSFLAVSLPAGSRPWAALLRPAPADPPPR